jgi:hypothetical protein
MRMSMAARSIWRDSLSTLLGADFGAALAAMASTWARVAAVFMAVSGRMLGDVLARCSGYQRSQ